MDFHYEYSIGFHHSDKIAGALGDNLTGVTCLSNCFIKSNSVWTSLDQLSLFLKKKTASRISKTFLLSTSKEIKTLTKLQKCRQSHISFNKATDLDGKPRLGEHKELRY